MANKTYIRSNDNVISKSDIFGISWQIIRLKETVFTHFFKAVMLFYKFCMIISISFDKAIQEILTPYQIKLFHFYNTHFLDGTLIL